MHHTASIQQQETTRIAHWTPRYLDGLTFSSPQTAMLQHLLAYGVREGEAAEG